MTAYHSPGGILLYNGWGRPRPLSQGEAQAYSVEVIAEGRCGALTQATYGSDGQPAGVVVCTSSDPEKCVERNLHQDMRHMIVWEHKSWRT